MKILIVLLCILVAWAGWLRTRNRETVVLSDLGSADVKIIEELTHWIDFTKLEDTWIDFDVENNKWIYSGDLDEMMEVAIEMKDYHIPHLQGLSFVIVEIIRELKEEKETK